jgi:hypothetical protein
MPSKIQLRRDTSANWIAANPVLSVGEPGLEINTNLIKYGDGVTPWNNLPYSGVSPIVDNNLIPSITDTYTLGNTTHRWKDLYLTGNSLYIGNVVLSESDGNLMINGETLPNADSIMAARGPDQNNWNNIIITGTYLVNRTSWAGTIGTPLDSQIFKGTLMVNNTSYGDETVITQVFYPGLVITSDVAVQFNRTYWEGSWTSWYKIVNTDQIVSGGEF